MLRVMTHPDCAGHRAPEGHPESPQRLAAAMRGIDALDGIEVRQARTVDDVTLRLAHPQAYIDGLNDVSSRETLDALDPDTWLGPGSVEAARLATGAVCNGVDQVLQGDCERCFAVVRPPGHHAEPSHAMGFCLFNHIAVAALRALEHHGLDRVAVCDFDVHHGNGTEAILAGEARTLFISSHQWPLYPGTGKPDEPVADNIVNATLPSGAGSNAFRALWRERLLPRLEDFQPELVLVSAGFDAHRADPLAQLELDDEDFGWIGRRLREVADRHATGRLVATLEGGYDLEALERSVREFARALI